MKTVAVVPARGGSKGLPRKNLAEINGRSLVRIAVELGQAIAAIDDVVVSSDDDEILDEGRKCGAHVAVRPAQLARDCTSTLEVLRSLCAERRRDDTIVVLQPTSPLRDVSDVVRCLDAVQRKGAKAAATVTPVEHPSEWECSLDGAGVIHRSPEAVAVQRRQDAQLRYRLNGAVFATTVGHMLCAPLVSDATVGIIMPKERSVDIDGRVELALARVLAQRAGGSQAGSEHHHALHFGLD